LYIIYSFNLLDNRSEKLVQSAINKASQGRTTIIIAHRLTTIRNADLILVFDKGMVVEQGTHNELIQIQNGIYRALANQPDQEEPEEEEEEDDDVNQIMQRQISNTSSSKIFKTLFIVFFFILSFFSQINESNVSK